MFSSNTSQVAQDQVFVEDVFSTWLYTGNGSTQTITNGIDLAGKGGMVFQKARSAGLGYSFVYDTARGAAKYLETISAAAQGDSSLTQLSSFNSNGFSLSYSAGNDSGYNFASWTFRKQPKFFDVVTYTGNGATSRSISHSLGSVPGFIVLKKTSGTGDWLCYHRSIGTGNRIFLNYTNASSADADAFASVTSTAFSVSTNTGFNDSGSTYVAYLFAHDAGGFGLTGTDNVISCGSYTGNGSATGPTVTLGYEPQWVMIKAATRTGGWNMVDSMRGLTTNSSTPTAPSLLANSSAAEYAAGDSVGISSTGFQIRNAGDTDVNANGQTYIYIAIRRGPMKTPTTGTSVYTGVSQAGGGTVTTNFPVDLAVSKQADNALAPPTWYDRLRGSSTTGGPRLVSSGTAAEVNSGVGLGFDNNTGYVDGAFGNVGPGRIYWNFRRAPGFFDVVCYTGTGANRTVSHNLGVVPELMIFKRRNSTGAWAVYSAPTNSANVLYLNQTSAAAFSSTFLDFTDPTASVFTLGTLADANASGGTFVAYLFASCPGVSKVGSYTGNGTSLTANCGFTGGARFVLIKRTDSLTTGNWVVFDSARGIVAGNDPALYLNSTAAQVTGVDAVDADSSGFIVNQDATFDLNASGGLYIFLAIA
jgi:hypothetical protein